MKFLSFKLAKELQSAGFVISPDSYHPDSLCPMITNGDPRMFHIFQFSAMQELLAKGYTWLPSFEDIMSHEYLRSWAYEAVPEPIVYNRARPYSLERGFSGSSAVEAAARAWLFVHSKRQGDGGSKL